MARSNMMSLIYFAIALVCMIWSWSHFLQYFASAESLHPRLFFNAVMANEASRGVAIDATFAGAVFSLMAVTRASRDGVKWPWAYVLITFLIGLCVALPLYLGFRERVLAAREIKG